MSSAVVLSTLALLASAESPRLVTLGAAVTETVAALGLESQIVAVDTTSTWPPTLAEVPRVGYLRTLPAEGVLGFAPSRVLATEAAGPPATMERLKTAGVEVVFTPEAVTWPEAKARMLKIGKAVGKAESVAELVADNERRLAAVKARFEAELRPKVLFLFAHGRAPMVGGRGSVADAMITLAGGQNALPEVEGHKPPTTEAVAASQAEVILTTPRVLAGLGGMEGLSRVPGLGATPALKVGRVVTMDGGLLLAFGPRTAEAVEQLASALHPKSAKR